MQSFDKDSDFDRNVYLWEKIGQVGKLTAEELRIIEQTKRQAPEADGQKTPGKWTAVLSMLILAGIFVVFVFCALLIVSLVTR